jgi:peptidoglycan/xylan/chitin deacetylase (PgdA/CDA1 family)
MPFFFALVLLGACCFNALAQPKTVVLTFDDSVKSHVTYVAPLLEKHGFNATFFITEGFAFKTRKDLYMTWDEIKSLHDRGFEIGNHTQHHRAVHQLSDDALHASLITIENQCVTNGIPRPITFCYPGYATSEKALVVLKERGYVFARCGGERASHIAKENPLLLPQAFDGKPDCTLEKFKAAVDAADDTHIPILTFHGVPDTDHPWVSTDPKLFAAYMQHLSDEGFKVIALRDYPAKTVE